MIINFFYGLSFGGLGLAAYLQLRRGGDFPLRTLLPWLAAFGPFLLFLAIGEAVLIKTEE